MKLNLNLKNKLLAAGVLLVAVPLLVATLVIQNVASHMGSQALQAQAFQRLIAVRDIKSSQIEDYFANINNQVLTFANDKMVIDAMDSFGEAFHGFRYETNQLDVSALKSDVAAYYRQDFAKRFSQLNPDNALDVSRLQTMLDDEAVALQYAYIAQNRHPLGEKHKLDAADDSSGYSQIHADYHPHIRDYLDKFGYYDIFLVDAETGHVVYSVFKELDYATSLISGPYADSGLGKAFKAARKLKAGQSHLEDFAAYLPSYNGHASFIATPIVKHGKTTGVLVFQMPIDKINAVMTQEQKWAAAGLGDSGEVYLVGGDHFMRNDSRFLIEDPEGYFTAVAQSGMSPDDIARIRAQNTSIGLQRIDSDSAQLALAGEKGVHVIPDYRNVPVVSAYAPLIVQGLQWGILAEIDEQEAFAAVSDLESSILLSASLVSLLMLLAGSALAWFGTRMLIRPIHKLVHAVGEIEANSDLTRRIEIDSDDEIGAIGNALNSMLIKFHSSLGRVSNATSQLASSSEEMSSITAETNQAVKNQLSETSQVAVAVTQMSSTVQNVANNTSAAADAADQANAATEQGRGVVNSTVNSIRHLAEDVESIATTIAKVEQDSAAIDSVLEVIKSIAEQTNLLALNAAIEAARAGDHGRGFAVVADEVRTLASRTQESTAEIQEMISRLQGGSRKAVEAMEAGSRQANTTVEQANQAGAALDKIAQAVATIHSLNTEIASAAEEQAAVSTEISSNIVHINEMVEQTSEGANQTAMASEQLAQLAVELQGQVYKFKI